MKPRGETQKLFITPPSFNPPPSPREDFVIIFDRAMITDNNR